MKKYFIFALIIGALVLPRLSLAATSAEIQAQINAIMAQIKQLQVQLTQLQTQQTSAVWCHDFNVNLGIGNAADSEVDALWTALGKEGFSVQAGKFDETTASAITGFQQKYKDEILTPWGLNYGTGYVGKTTRAKLNKLYGCGGNVTPPPFTCIQIACASNQKTICPAGLGDNGCPLPCKCVPGPIECAEPICQPGYTRYDAGEKDVYSCPIIKCLPSTSNQPPVISGVSGPTTLKVNETGTWTVKASDPEQGVLFYSVRWGDENITGIYNAAQRSWSYIQTAEFTHSYASAGVYSPTFTVTDDKGLSAKTSISVNVGETVVPSITVLSPNGGEAWTKGTTQTIKWQDNTPILLCPTGASCVSPAPKYYDIKLVSYYPPCTGEVCPALYIAPYTIAKNIQGFSYNWSAGKYLEVYGTGIGTGGIAPDGSYTIQICQTNSTTCDSSNSYFKIVSGTVQESVKVISPNGGETWQKGSTQIIKWNSANAPSGSWVALFLTNGSYIAQGLPVSGSYSWKVFSEYCSGDVCGFPMKEGSDYKIEARLYTGPALCIGLCPPAPQPTLLARDYSDAPFSIVAATDAAGALAPSGQYSASILENMKITLDQIQKAINDLYR